MAAEPSEHRAELVQSPNRQAPRGQEPRPPFSIRVCPTETKRRGSSADRVLCRR
jgi:hypothetical protein